MAELDAGEVERRFRYVAPDHHRATLHSVVGLQLMTTAKALADILPESREKSLAVTKLEEARMWANAAIALNVPDMPEDDPTVAQQDPEV